MEYRSVYEKHKKNDDPSTCVVKAHPNADFFGGRGIT